MSDNRRSNDHDGARASRDDRDRAPRGLVPDVELDFSSNQRSGDSATSERLQKVMASAGVASRRVSEQLIAQGRVTVNGVVVNELGARIEPSVDLLAVNGVAVQLDGSRRYVMLNKPTGVVSTLRDENGRPDLRQFTDRFDDRLFNVGRLDADTSGLLLLTNDGALANVLAHPRFGVEKTYIATVKGTVTAQALRRLRDGVELDDGPAIADKARLLGEPSRGRSMVELTLHSGRNRVVRRMMAEVGHPVIDLVRRQFGPLHLGPLPIGRTRELTKDELGALLTLSRDAGADGFEAAGGSDAADDAAEGTDVADDAAEGTDVADDAAEGTDTADQARDE